MSSSPVITSRPTLTSTFQAGPPYSGSGCASYTVSEVCNGSGEKSVCIEETLCVPTQPPWSTILGNGEATCQGSAICASTTTHTVCKDGVEGRSQSRNTQDGFFKALSADAVSTTADTPALSPVATPAQSIPLAIHGAGRDAAARSLISDRDNEKGLTIRNDSIGAGSLLKPRDDGFGSDGCLYTIGCALCLTAVKVPCINAKIYAITGGASGTDVMATVTEDGVIKCQASVHCSIFDDLFDNENDTCAGIPNYDCGGGNSMIWRWNEITYTSAHSSDGWCLDLETKSAQRLRETSGQSVFPPSASACHATAKWSFLSYMLDFDLYEPRSTD